MTQKAGDPENRSPTRSLSGQFDDVSLAISENQSGIAGAADVTELSMPGERGRRGFLVDFDESETIEWKNAGYLNTSDLDTANSWGAFYFRSHSLDLSEDHLESFGLDDHPNVERVLSDDTQDAQASVHKLVIEEVNKRVVAPLLLVSAILLFIASIGALLNGGLLVAMIFLPAPLVTFWYMWGMRNRW